MRKLATLIALAAVLGFTAPAQAKGYDFTDRFYGGPASGIDNLTVGKYSIDSLVHYGKWVQGSKLDIFRPDFKRAYVRSHTPLPQCLYLRRDPYNWATNHSTSTFVGVWAVVPGRLCRAGP